MTVAGSTLELEATWTPDKGEKVVFDETTEKARGDLVKLIEATVDEPDAVKKVEIVKGRGLMIEKMDDPLKIKGLWRAVESFREVLPGNGGDNGAKVLGLYFVLAEGIAKSEKTESK